MPRCFSVPNARQAKIAVVSSVPSPVGMRMACLHALDDRKRRKALLRVYTPRSAKEVLAPPASCTRQQHVVTLQDNGGLLTDAMEGVCLTFSTSRRSSHAVLLQWAPDTDSLSRAATSSSASASSCPSCKRHKKQVWLQGSLTRAQPHQAAVPA